MRSKNTAKALWAAVSLSLLFLSGCGSDETLIEESLVDVEEQNVGTSTAEYGNLEAERTLSGTLYYPIRTELTSPVSGCAMKEIAVKQNDHVKAGDLIASLEPVSEDQRSEKQRQIEQKKAEIEKVRNYTNQQIASYQQTMSASSDPNERQICQLKIQEQQMILDHMETEYADDIATLEAEMQQIQSVESVEGIYAPYDGVISNVYQIPEGTVLTEGRVIVEMYSEETVLVQAKNPGDIRYGQTVQVFGGVGDMRTEYKGTVVGADNPLEDSLKNDWLYIRLEEEFDPQALVNIEIKATGYQVENVLVVKAAAVFTQKEQQYVYLLEDGELKRRHVIVGGSDGTNTWILQGLSEGDVVSIQ